MKIPATIPTAPGALPLLGHALSLVRNPLAFLSSLPSYGDLVRIRIGPAAAIVICDPDLTQTVLRNDRTFDKGGALYDTVREAVGHGVITTPHDAHRRQRRLTQPAFHRDRLPIYAQAMTEQIDVITASWRHGQVLDVPTEMLTLTMRVIARTMFSDTLPSAALSQAIVDLRTLVAGMYRRTITPPLLNRLPTPANRRYLKARSRLQRTVEAIIAKRRGGGTLHDDLLSALLTAHDLAVDENEQAGSTDTEVRDNVLQFFNAGSETTSNLLSWALHLLAHHPGLEQRLHAEVDTVLDGAPATHEHLPKLALTSRVITETLRLYPPAWISTRIAASDIALGGHSIPTGATLVFSPYLLHHCGDFYKDPTLFDPDRWSDSPPPANAYVPFGGGARKCIGDHFAIMEATLALATITSRWTLKPADNRTVRPTPAMTLEPHRLHMRLIGRHEQRP